MNLNKIENKLTSVLATGRALTLHELAKLINTNLEVTGNTLRALIKEDMVKIRINRKREYYYLNPENLPNREIAEKTLEIPVGMKYCRHCYKHLAGYIGVKVTNALVNKGYVVPKDWKYELTPNGRKWLEDFGINFQELDENHRLFTKQCLDFSERKSHLGGHLGDAILKRMLDTGMAENVPDSREIKITGKGKAFLKKVLELSINH